MCHIPVILIVAWLTYAFPPLHAATPSAGLSTFK